MINTTVDIPICLSIEDIKAAPEEDTELQVLKWYVIRGWATYQEGSGTRVREILANKT